MSSDVYTLGVDIGGTNIRLGLVNENGSVKSFEKYPSEPIAGELAVSKLGDLIENYTVGNVPPAAVCIGFPATVDKSKTTVLNAPNLKGFDGVCVGKLLGERFGIPVLIDKDVNLLLMGDAKRLKLTANDVVACYVGTGIGNAIMVNGQLISGANGAAGELGHIPFGDSADVCGCGNSGCAETVCGGRYLSRLRDELFFETNMSALFTRHGDHPLIKEYIERLGRVIATEVNIMDPEVLLIGGGVIGMEDFPKVRLTEAVLSYVRRPLPHDRLKIVYSPDRDGIGGVLGAGICAWRNLK